MTPFELAEGIVLAVLFLIVLGLIVTAAIVAIALIVGIKQAETEAQRRKDQESS